MACNSVAVVRVKLAPAIGAEVMDNERAQEAVRKFLEQALGVPATARRYEGYNGERGFVVFDVGTDPLRVVVTQEGEVQITDYAARSYGYGAQPQESARAKALKPKLEAILDPIVRATLKEKARAKLRQSFNVESDVAAPGGRRVITLRV
jgi:hypothetical protein